MNVSESVQGANQSSPAQEQRKQVSLSDVVQALSNRVKTMASQDDGQALSTVASSDDSNLHSPAQRDMTSHVNTTRTRIPN
jgi:hypothetical protein